MHRHRFERLVERAVRQIPPELQAYLDNVAIIVEPVPNAAQIARAGLNPGDRLYGLYEGIPLIQRSSDYGMVLPDKITIFQETIEADCTSDHEIVQEVNRTVLHELAHHFGIDDNRLRELKRY
ncbi:MAG TPA: metallopeptidase family protein [Chloroflexota bacterium]|nr:metallopeptidase family protein [Chloroflexota bacterium]